MLLWMKQKLWRQHDARRQRVKLQNFSEGDFVLAATTTGRSGIKPALVWRGPKIIIRALNDVTFEVQDIVQPFEVALYATPLACSCIGMMHENAPKNTKNRSSTVKVATWW
ncbi:hypothetical protein V7S43_012716 [Phytophthora oleae]|uniref:Uncharacterized protein n=1 Tax=Phytophthora oleae TaxID=2107226 RepID=A0ABD3FBJ4_9STRA